MVRANRTVLLLATAAGLSLIGLPEGAAAAQPSTWNFQQADVPAGQGPGSYGKGVLIAVVDTWVDPSQPEFAGRFVDEADCLPGSCTDHRYAPDSCVHGTHVAGTIASADYGVAPEADILAVQVLSGPSGAPDPSASCSGSATTVAAGIDFAVTKGAKVINLSVGDYVPGVFQSPDISAAVANAAQHGVVVVFAAGNQGVPLTDSYGNDALIVAATGPSGQLSSYSNFNTALTGSVNVAAPGGDTGSSSACSTATCILSTFPGGKLGLLEGTSMAAPHVAGLAALLLAQDPGRGVGNVFATIEHTARPLAGAGAGLIDAGRALGVEAASHPPAGDSGGSTASTRLSPTDTAGAGAIAAGPPQSAAAAGPSARPAAGGSATVRAATTEPTTTVAAARPARPAQPSPQAVGAPAPSPPPRKGSSPGWMARNAAVLVIACLLVAADLLALLWRRDVRGLVGRAQLPRS